MLLLLLSLSPLANDKVIVHHLVTQSNALLDGPNSAVFYLVPPDRTSDNYCSNSKQCYAPCCPKLLKWLSVTTGVHCKGKPANNEGFLEKNSARGMIHHSLAVVLPPDQVRGILLSLPLLAPAPAPAPTSTPTQCRSS